MKAQEAAEIASHNFNNTPEAKAYKRIVEEIRKKAIAGERQYNTTSIPSGTVAMLRRDGYRVEQGDGAHDWRDAICFSVHW